MPWPLSPSLFAKRVWSGSCRVDPVHRKAKFGMGLKVLKPLFLVFFIFFISPQVIIFAPDCWRCRGYPLCPSANESPPHSHRDVKGVIQTTSFRERRAGKDTASSRKQAVLGEKKAFPEYKDFLQISILTSPKVLPWWFLCLHFKLSTYYFLIRSYHRFKCHCSPQDIAREQYSEMLSTSTFRRYRASEYKAHYQIIVQHSNKIMENLYLTVHPS